MVVISGYLVLQERGKYFRFLSLTTNSLDSWLVNMVFSVALRPPYEKLPTEVLVRIFRLASDGSVAPGATRHIIGHVCKSWRQVSRSTRSLWSEIVIEFLFDDDIEPDWQGPSIPELSLKLVEQCLILSKTHPLDIRIILTGELDSGAPSVLTLPISLLLANTIRWRTFTCISPPWVLRLLEDIHSFQSTTLEAVTLRSTEGDETLALTESDVTFSSSLRHLDVNFVFPQLKPRWDKITSLRMGFTTPSQCHNVLSQMMNLASLHLIHIGDSQPASHHTQILLHDLRQLKLSACAINEVLDDLQLPNLEQLYLTQPGSRAGGVDRSHSSHSVVGGRCPNLNRNNVVMERIAHLLRGAVVPLCVLDVAWGVSLDALIPILRFHCRETMTLRVWLREENIDSAPSLLDALTVSTTGKDNILPNLSEFSLGFHRCRDTIFQGERLERMVRSRWNTDPATTKKLCTLRLQGDHRTTPFYPSYPIAALELELEAVMRQYTASSLNSTLQDFEDEGLDVQWIFEDEDVLKRGRRYTQQLQ